MDDAVLYTPKLSGLVKLAQLLVVQHAVGEHQAGRIDFPNELVSELQDRFMVYGSDTLMNWILNLRAYGKKERDNTTSVSNIIWSDDSEQLSYQALRFTINLLRWFLHDYVQLAQAQLHDLLLVPKEDSCMRQRHVPTLELSALKDDPSNREVNHSFLRDPENQAVLGDKERHLLHQIRSNPRLARRFLMGGDSHSWDQGAVLSYVQQASAFLRSLLLLIHMTGGQPARGSELLVLRWRNSETCDVRNITIENGMVCFVTSYYKNYSTTNSTKIIHRYLPAEVGELLVYYIWLVIPFLEQLHILNPLSGICDLGSFLWPACLAATKRLACKKPKKAKRLDGRSLELSQESSSRADVQKQDEP